MYVAASVGLLLISFLFHPYGADAALVIGKPKILPTSLQSGLVGYWPFNPADISGATVYDRSASGNHASTTVGVRPFVSPGKAGQALAFNTNTIPRTLESGLVGWWNMDTNQVSGSILTDLSSSATNGTLTGVSLVAGKIGQALSFTGGNNSSIAVTSTPIQNFGVSGQAFTMSAWFNRSAACPDALNPGIISKGPANNVVQITMTCSDSSGKLSVQQWNGSLQVAIETTAGYIDSNWHHVAAVSDGTNMSLYVDGVLAGGPTDATGSFLSANSTLGIGYRTDAVDRAFTGSIDDVRVYNRALSATEITGLYNNPVNLMALPSSSLNTLTAVTLGTWVKYASTTATQVLMRKASTATSSNAYELKSNGTNFQLQIGTTTPITITGTTIIRPNVWYYVAGTADGSNMRLYVNGVQEASTAQSGTITTGSTNWTNSLFFGSDDLPSKFLVGVLDEARVYNRALSASEITQLTKLGASQIGTVFTKPKTAQSSLVGHWTFDGTQTSNTLAYDSSTSGVVGVLTAGPQKVSGKIGQAYRFTGNGSGGNYIDMGSPAALRPENITVNAWVKIEQATGADQGIISSEHGAFSNPCTDGGNGGYILWWRTTQKIEFLIYNGPCTWVTARSNEALSYGRYYHVVGTYDGTTARLYIDGVLQTTTGSGSAISYPASVAQNFAVGKYSTNAYSSSVIDDVRIYNRALSASEIYTLYREGNQRIQIATTKPPTLTANLIGHWTFDGKDIYATTALDKSNSNIGGAITGPVKKVAGKLNQAFSFDGTSNYVRVPDSSTFEFTNGSGTDLPFSISMWIRPRNLGAGVGGPLITKWNTSSAVEWDFITYNNTLEMVLRSDSSNSTSRFASFGTGYLNRWTHVSMSYDGSESSNGIRVYINGVRSDTDTITAGTYVGMSDTSADIAIGGRFNGGNLDTGFIFKGDIDDVRIFDRALTASEMYQLYRLGQ